MLRRVLRVEGGGTVSLAVEVGPGVEVEVHGVDRSGPQWLRVRRRVLDPGEAPGAGLAGGLPGLAWVTGADVEALAGGHFDVSRVPRFGAVVLDVPRGVPDRVGLEGADGEAVPARDVIRALACEVVALREAVLGVAHGAVPAEVGALAAALVGRYVGQAGKVGG